MSFSHRLQQPFSPILRRTRVKPGFSQPRQHAVQRCLEDTHPGLCWGDCYRASIAESIYLPRYRVPLRILQRRAVALSERHVRSTEYYLPSS